MRKPNGRESTMLVILAIVLMAVLYGLDWDIVGLGGGTAGPDNADDKVGQAPIINLARLNQDPADYDPKGRNLFEYGPPPRSKTVPLPPVPEPTRIERLPQPKAVPQVRQPAAQPQPPRVQAPKPGFKYIGYMGPKDDKIAVFDAGDETLLARVGDVVQEQFLVREFKFRKVVLGFTDQRFAQESAELELKKPK